MSTSGDHAQGALLGQLRPADTAQNLLFTAKMRTEISRLLICNNTAAGVTFRVFHRNPPTVAGLDNALFYDKVIAANDTFVLDANSLGSGIQMESDDELVVVSGTAGALTFSAYGITESLAARVRYSS